MKKNKPKTHKAAAKRFKITGKVVGEPKVLHRAQGSRHRISHKSKSQVRRLRRMKVVTGEFSKKIKQLLRIA